MKNLILGLLFYFTWSFASFAQIAIVFEDGTTDKQKKTVISGLKQAENALAKRFEFKVCVVRYFGTSERFLFWRLWLILY